MSNQSDAIADHDTYGKTLQWYRGIFRANANIADAMGYSTLPLALRQAIWDRLDEVDGNGGVFPTPKPAAATHDPFDPADNAAIMVVATEAEAIDIYSRKVAQSFYIDAHGLVPWKLQEMDLESCRGLFDPVELFGQWDITGGPPYLTFWEVMDHSPSAAWYWASEFTSNLTTQKEALAQILENVGNVIGHYTPNPVLGWPSGHAVSLATLDEYFTGGAEGVGNSFYDTNVDSGVDGYFISRGGCHGTGPLTARLLRALNIPAFDRHDRSSSDETPYYDSKPTLGKVGHHRCEYPSIKWQPNTTPSSITDPQDRDGLVLVHGDDIYGAKRDESLPFPARLYAKLISRSYFWGIHENSSQDENRFEHLGGLREYSDYLIAEANIGHDISMQGLRGRLGNGDRLASTIKGARIENKLATHAMIDGEAGLTPNQPRVYLVGFGNESYYPNLYVAQRSVVSPPYAEDGDLIIFAHSYDNAATPTPVDHKPAGFTDVTGSPYSCGDTVLTVAYKFASSEPTSYNFASPGANAASGAVTWAFRGADTVAPIGEIGTSCNVTTAGNLTMPTIAATGLDEFRVLWVAAKSHQDLNVNSNYDDGWPDMVPQGYWEMLLNQMDYTGTTTNPGWSMLTGTALLEATEQGTSFGFYQDSTRTADGVACMSLLISAEQST